MPTANVFAQGSDTVLNASPLSTQLDTILVSGVRLAQTAAETGSSLDVITSEDMEILGFNFVLDALATAPGVSVSANGAFGGQTSVRMRGATTGQTLVLIDGVPVTDASSPGGGYDFARLDTENIARIEVLKGPHSTLWGTDAMGGVISIHTKIPNEGLGGSVFGSYESFDTFRGGLSVGDKNNSGHYRLAITGSTSDGISKADEDRGNSESDGHQALTLSARGGMNINDDATVSASLLWSEAKTEFDSFMFGAQGNIADGDELSETSEISGNLSLKTALFDGKLDNQILFGYANIARDNYSAGTPSFAAQGARHLVRYQGSIEPKPNHKMAFGTEYEGISVSDDTASILSVFGLYAFNPVRALTLTSGLRTDRHSDQGQITTARFAAALSATNTLTLRGSWGQGFKAPTLFQSSFFCCGALAANAKLEPETSNGFDVGLDWRGKNGRAVIGVSYFDQRTANQIDFAFDSGTYENIAKVTARGIELAGDFKFAEPLSLLVNYTYIDAKDETEIPLARIPKHAGDIVLEFNPKSPFSGALLVRFTGQKPNTDGTNLAGWVRVDANGRYALSDRLEVYGRVENVLDQAYQHVLGYGTPDASASIGVRLRY